MAAKISSSWNVIETKKDFNPSYLESVLQGECGAYVLRNFVSEGLCKEAIERFIEHPRVQDIKGKNGLLKQDLQVKGPPLEFKRDYDQYFKYAKENQKMLDSLFIPSEHPLTKIAREADRYFQKKAHVHFRPMRRNKVNGSYGMVQRWKGGKDGFIAPIHTDSFHYQSYRSLETSHIDIVGSCVFCLENKNASGFTRIYNYRPTKKENKMAEDYYFKQDELRKLKVKPEYLKKIETAEVVEVTLQPGDILFFCVNNFHSVGTLDSSNPRTTSYMFWGPMREGDYIYWF